jgi:hypothetical protein
MVQPEELPHRLNAQVKDGVVIIFSDAHYWPGIVTIAHRAVVALTKQLKPKLIIANGDLIDGATISRHARIGWDNRPPLHEEVETTKERLHEVMMAAPKARRIWSLGNHDARFETKLANTSPEYAKVHGVSLKDHFPHWEPCWAIHINDNVVVKHRYKGGMHAVHNNALWSGKTMITGHDHHLRVHPFNDYNGLRWGVSTGTLANPDGPQFVDYTEDNPKNWRSGFVVLDFKDGELLWPTVVHVIDEKRGLVQFGRELLKV